MPQIGWLEILAIVIVAILVLGPKEFPIALKKIGSYFGKLKNTLGNFQKEINTVSEEIDVENKIDNKKDILVESTLLKFKNRAAVIVIPALLTPGIRARI